MVSLGSLSHCGPEMGGHERPYAALLTNKKSQSHSGFLPVSGLAVWSQAVSGRSQVVTLVAAVSTVVKSDYLYSCTRWLTLVPSLMSNTP